MDYGRTEISGLMRALGAKKSEIHVFFYLYSQKRYADVREISQSTGISEKTVRLCLKRLSKRGYVVVKRKGKKLFYKARGMGFILNRFTEKVSKRLEEILTHLRSRRL